LGIKDGACKCNKEQWEVTIFHVNESNYCNLQPLARLMK
jgi:hypothetical protein